MRDIFLEEAKNWGNADALSNCLALTDQISDAHTTQEPTRLNFILMALCLKGQAKYNIDTKEQTVKAGDLLFVSERHIVDNYSASADFGCLCIMVSTAYCTTFQLLAASMSCERWFKIALSRFPLTLKVME